ncbi:MAG TPA: helix-turn-helix domain-containing protein [Gemmatimonadales bacterium]|nr:helix-turn-helix domain-containing protein [Gemmatimonadales bacterium]
MNPTPLEYVEHHPVGPLGTRVRCIWALRAPTDPASRFEPVFPDGCMEVVFNLAAQFERLGPDRAERQASELLVGQLLEAIRLRPTGRIDILGVRFQPWGLKGSGWISPEEVAGRTVPVADLGGPLRGTVSERLSEIPDLRRRCLAMERILTGSPFTSGDLSPPPALVSLARGTLRSVSGAAAAAGVSTRQIERLSAQWTGLSPRELIHLVRFQRALARLRRFPEQSLARIAHESGFADHAHFTRDFSRFAGVTPSLFRASIAPMTAAFIPE